MLDLAPGWQSDVERGPDWLFIRLHGPQGVSHRGTALAESLWDSINQHFVYRVVLELDAIGPLDSYLVGQLVLLHKLLHTHGGVLRLCNLSHDNQQVLHTLRLDGR